MGVGREGISGQLVWCRQWDNQVGQKVLWWLLPPWDCLGATAACPEVPRGTCPTEPPLPGLLGPTWNRLPSSQTPWPKCALSPLVSRATVKARGRHGQQKASLDWGHLPLLWAYWVGAPEVRRIFRVPVRWWR